MSEPSATGWDHTFDLVIVGSGAGAMTAGVVAHDRGAKALLVEKSNRYGGSSAMSGGSLWVPCNHLMAEAGIEDDPEDAMAYLREITAGLVPEEKLQKFV
ncbi:MAG: FAD-binding protein, partial [Deltaproteobacteria bacterium]|nr:FAD-binding protein [Deltaproteobacteria bacterium]